MKETLHNARGADNTRVKRAFRWVITFRDFPTDSWQTVDGDSMMRDALTFFTKGRAEFFLDGVKREDRVPGTLSSEHDIVGEGGTFKLVYVEPTTRICIPRLANRGNLPVVEKMHFKEQTALQLKPGQKLLVCLGSVDIAGKIFAEEQTFRVTTAGTALCKANTILLEFLT